jgi:hypothetical protein
MASNPIVAAGRAYLQEAGEGRLTFGADGTMSSVQDKWSGAKLALGKVGLYSDYKKQLSEDLNRFAERVAADFNNPQLIPLIKQKYSQPVPLTKREIVQIFDAAERFTGAGPAKDDQRRVEVFVWPYADRNHPGHAAVGIRNQMNQKMEYISHWPSVPSGYKGSAPSLHPASRKVDGAMELGDKTQFRLLLGLYSREYLRLYAEYQQDKTPASLKRATAFKEKLVKFVNNWQDIGGFKLRADKPIPEDALRKWAAFAPRGRQAAGEGLQTIGDRSQDVFGVTPDSYFLPVAGRNRTAPTSGDRAPEDKFVLFGLDEKAMSGFSGQFKNAQERYRLVSKTQNCAGMALRAIRSGGGDLFADLESAGGRVYEDPNRVALLCERIINETDRLEKLRLGAHAYAESLATLPRHASFRESLRDESISAEDLEILAMGTREGIEALKEQGTEAVELDPGLESAGFTGIHVLAREDADAGTQAAQALSDLAGEYARLQSSPNHRQLTILAKDVVTHLANLKSARDALAKQRQPNDDVHANPQIEGLERAYLIGVELLSRIEAKMGEVAAPEEPQQQPNLRQEGYPEVKEIKATFSREGVNAWDDTRLREMRRMGILTRELLDAIPDLKRQYPNANQWRSEFVKKVHSEEEKMLRGAGELLMKQQLSVWHLEPSPMKAAGDSFYEAVLPQLSDARTTEQLDADFKTGMGSVAAEMQKSKRPGERAIGEALTKDLADGTAGLRAKPNANADDGSDNQAGWAGERHVRVMAKVLNAPIVLLGPADYLSRVYYPNLRSSPVPNHRSEWPQGAVVLAWDGNNHYFATQAENAP